MNIKQLFSAIDVHVLGEVFRIITHSPIRLGTNNVWENQEMLASHYTTIKKMLLKEPRGHRGITGCLILPSKEADFQLLYFQHDGAIPFKQEGVAASISALLETGNLEVKENGIYTIESVQGIYTVQADIDQHQIKEVRLSLCPAIQVSHFNASQIIELDYSRTYLIETLPKEIEDISTNKLEALTIAGNKKRLDCKAEGIEVTGVLFSKQLTENTFQTITFEKDGYIRRTPGMDSSIVCITANKQQISLTKPFRNTAIFSSHLTMLPSGEADNVFTFSVRPFIIGSLQFILDESDPLPAGFLLH